MTDSMLCTVLARAFLAGEQTVDQAAARATMAFGRPWRWIRPLAMRYILAFSGGTRPRLREVARFLKEDPDFLAARTRYRGELSIRQWLTESAVMLPVAAAESWDLPPIESSGELAKWLSTGVGELDWFADCKGLTARGQANGRLRHYHYRVLAKGSGGIRLIEAPKSRLKELQRWILTEMLDRIPPHPAAHGFRKGRSIQTFVEPHVGQRVILRMDLQNFFPSVSRGRVQALFRTAGYPEAVADLLGGICTSATPVEVWKDPGLNFDAQELREARELYRRPHLPQGAPASPALGNLCFYRADCRLAGLAQSAGAKYTRYADDLAFSGGAEFERRVERFSIHAAAVLHEEGFEAHHHKTRIMRQSVRQHLAGLVANQKVNIVRADFDQLKAILTNCVRLRPEGQNREKHADFRAHLEGRVAFVEMIHAGKGRRLRNLFERIRWRE